MAIVKFQGNPVTTCGELPAVGTTLPAFSLTNGELADVTVADFAGKKKVITIVPSLDTPVCAASTRKFNETAAEKAAVLVVSADLPFAQGRFCSAEGIENVTALSTFRSDFAQAFGVEITDSPLAGLTARAVIVADENNQIIYSAFVEEITEEPDYPAILELL